MLTELVAVVEIRHNIGLDLGSNLENFLTLNK